MAHLTGNMLHVDAGLQRERFIEKATTYQSSWAKFWQSFQVSQTYTQMIDISSHNRISADDWVILRKAGVRGVYIRYFIGDRLDTEFDMHLTKAIDVGMECIGAYGVPFDHLEPMRAANHFFAAEHEINKKLLGYSLPSWNDVELTYVDTVSERADFHYNLFEEVSGLEIYSAAWFWDQYLPGVSFPNVKKTVANYTSSNTPWLPRDWSMDDINCWQYNIWKKYPWHDISFAPIPYALDQDRFYGTEDELRAKAGYVINPPNDLEERVTDLELEFELMKTQFSNHEHGKPK